jgi:hypothetical protein
VELQKKIKTEKKFVFPLYTWHSIELQATTSIPEWDNQKISSAQEEDIFIDEKGEIHWVLERQTSFHLVR